MTNFEVAKAFIENALAYGKAGDLQTVMSNLEYIKKCLADPFEINEDYSEDDFK